MRSPSRYEQRTRWRTRRELERSEKDDRGSVSAEFALAMPAVALVLLLCLSGMQVAGLQVRLQDAAAAAARSLARGDGGSASAVAALIPGATTSTYANGELQCARVSAPAAGALAFTGLRLEASSCALGGGR